MRASTESTMLDMMGHVSSAMLRRYSHIRAKARRDAIDALEGKVSDAAVKVMVKEVPNVAEFEEKANPSSLFVS